jgi:hypothetical protein
VCGRKALVGEPTQRKDPAWVVGEKIGAEFAGDQSVDMYAEINRTTLPMAEAERHQLWVQVDVDGVARCDYDCYLGSARTGHHPSVPFIRTHGVVHRHKTTARTLADPNLAPGLPEATVGHALLDARSRP